MAPCKHTVRDPVRRVGEVEVTTCQQCGTLVAVTIEPDGTWLLSDDAAELLDAEHLRALQDEVNARRSAPTSRDYTHYRITQPGE